MNDNIKRQKIIEREHFSYEERLDVAKKSDMKCCRCGKKVFPDYGGTVDHFIPLHKGGANRMINLVWLCKECNEEKDDKIVDLAYLNHLKQEYFDEISGYFDSYVRSFEYIGKSNILMCDQYEIRTIDEVQRKSKTIYGTNYQLKRVRLDREDEFSNVLGFYIKYLKKYDVLESEEKAREDINEYKKGGCIYIVERHGEIKTAAMVLPIVRDESWDEDVPSFLSIDLFSLYSNVNAFTLLNGIAKSIPGFIMREQNIHQMRVRYGMVGNDSLAYRFNMGNHTESPGKSPMVYSFIRIGTKDAKDEIEEYEDEMEKFFKKLRQTNTY